MSAAIRPRLSGVVRPQQRLPSAGLQSVRQSKRGESFCRRLLASLLSGLGGDPYASGQLTVRKNNLYDLRVNFRQSYYYWNMNDLAALPNGLDGLTSNHNWATVRKMGSVNLLVHATNNLRFSFEYYRNTRDGVTKPRVRWTTSGLPRRGAPSRAPIRI